MQSSSCPSTFLTSYLYCYIYIYTARELTGPLNTKFIAEPSDSLQIMSLRKDSSGWSHSSRNVFHFVYNLDFLPFLVQPLGLFL